MVCCYLVTKFGFAATFMLVLSCAPQCKSRLWVENVVENFLSRENSYEMSFLMFLSNYLLIWKWFIVTLLEDLVLLQRLWNWFIVTLFEDLVLLQCLCMF